MESDCLLSKQSHTSIRRNKKRKAKSFTLLSRTPIKKQRAISKDEKKTCKLSTHNNQSSKKMIPVPRPFWNAFTNEKSQELWSATKTDCVDADLNGSFKKHALGSWFSVDLKTSLLKSQTNSQKTDCTLSMSSLYELLDNVPQKIDAHETTTKMKARKIRVYPDKEQKEILRQWLGTSRWTYNKVVHSIRTKGCKANKKELRLSWLNKTALTEQKYTWAMDTPYGIRDEAMVDVLKAIQSNQALKRPKFPWSI